MVDRMSALDAAQLILRLGYAQPTQPASRRPLSDVLLPAIA
jgi:hypothetical protein